MMITMRTHSKVVIYRLKSPSPAFIYIGRKNVIKYVGRKEKFYCDNTMFVRRRNIIHIPVPCVIQQHHIHDTLKM
jgi:hypothetical protein